MRFLNPFSIDPTKASVEDAMVALYGILHMHKQAKGKPLHMPLADAKFQMDTFLEDEIETDGPRCGTAACAAGSAALSSWFHNLAKSKGVRTTIEGRINDTFINTSTIWGDAYHDMYELFMGGEGAYGYEANLSGLRAATVKKALRRIVVKHFGEKAGERCDAVDAQPCILIK